MRVAYILKRYPRYSETFVVNEILAHERAGSEIHIFSLLSPEDTHFQDILSKVRAPVTYLTAGRLNATDFWMAIQETSQVIPDLFQTLRVARGEEVRYVHQAILLAREIRSKKIEHIHCHFASAATSVGRLAAHFSSVPYTFTAHAKDIFHQDVQRRDLETKFQDADAVITVSQFNVQYLNELLGHQSNLHRIYNGLDLSRFPYSSPACRASEIIAVGRLVEKKGFDTLVEACSFLKDRGTEFQCKIIGAGELEQALASQIRTLGLEKRIELTGPLPQNQVIQLIQEASVLVAPCKNGSDGNRDGLPTVLLESMALGTPVVSTEVSGIPEILTDSATGLRVPQRDAGKLAAAILKLLRDPGLRMRLALAARERIERDFDISKNAAELRKFFDGHRNNSAVKADPITFDNLRNLVYF
ncbi:glycosyltransferase family 4 protein [bacterium]|nr:glycosyltransferase family 4 protein [bacterium]MCI0602881.1 glycosyltransferase family 4 protein [bacterium]